MRDKTRIAYGPYKLEWRKEFLKRILEIEKNVRETGSDQSFSIISLSELELIRSYWRDEEYDWEDSVPKIFKETTGITHDWVEEDGAKFSSEDLTILKDLCSKHGLPSGLIARLLDQEENAGHKQESRNY